MKRKKSSRRKALWLLNGILLALTVAGAIGIFVLLNDQQPQSNNQLSATQPPATQEPDDSSLTPVASLEPSATPTPITPQFTDAVWIGVGDIMSHTPQLPGAYDKATDSYNFNAVFAPIADIVAEGDWKMANLETPMAGKDYGYTGYPAFNAPVELAEALWHSGFNILSTANNHTLDKGVKGAIRTLDHVQEIGFATVGSARDMEEAEQSVIIEHNDIAMGFLSYTYGTNGIPIPEGKEFIVNLIDKEKILNDIKRLRRDGAEVVTIALHFGNEYQTEPSEEQKTLARELIAAGADIIAGSHPHVLQPYEMVSYTDDQGLERQGLIIYSMGNFISNQRGDSKDYGAIFRVDLRKHYDTGLIEFKEVTVTPTWVHRYKPDENFRYRVLPVEATLAAKDDALLKEEDYETLEADFAMLTKRLTSMLKQ
ncbi:capsule biosynthesis protein [Paenibacillus montaniterrae]|uniref:Capsule biosynthesis protein n=1 Tax=Paenibacillus montaniterrae TaxID=429341 RepID=A0A920CX91_9BACL|nr:CapA family protein [Paenibacillus montaniterrae]GIP15053.1 capsule biosynthesis protein [Paenibacillus montaniterrae]